MFHKGSDPEDAQVPVYTLHRKRMIPDRSIHDYIDAKAFRSEISLTHVSDSSRKRKINQRITNAERSY
jgi:hypothetical protein